MALTLARDYGAHGDRHHPVDGATRRSPARAPRPRGWRIASRFELLDYRAADRRFDRIVSVGMFEHVGVVHYRAFFDTVARCLKPDGVALLHAIGRSDGPGSHQSLDPQIHLPRRLLPGAAEVLPAIERSAC